MPKENKTTNVSQRTLHVPEDFWFSGKGGPSLPSCMLPLDVVHEVGSDEYNQWVRTTAHRNENEEIIIQNAKTETIKKPTPDYWFCKSTTVSVPFDVIPIMLIHPKDNPNYEIRLAWIVKQCVNDEIEARVPLQF